MIGSRRVVTGIDDDGQTVITCDQIAPRTAEMTTMPGFWMSEIWAIDGVPQLPNVGDLITADLTESMPNFVPDTGNIRVRVWELPPATAHLNTTGAAAHDEIARLYPGFENTLDPDVPGMHITDTIDIDTVISGELVLRLETGQEVRLAPGETVIQLGTKHAWANEKDVPCKVITVMIGAKRPTADG